MEPICFETERLTLRSFRMDDTIPYFQLLAHPRVHCFVPDALDTPEQAADAVRTLMHTKDGSALSVCLKETGTWIGTVFGLWEGGHLQCVLEFFFPSGAEKAMPTKRPLLM